MQRMLFILLGAAAVSVPLLAAQPKQSDTTYSPKRMADGKQWTTRNLNVNTAGSYCYEDAELNCRQYGRLFTLDSAQQGFRSHGSGWP